MLTPTTRRTTWRQIRHVVNHGEPVFTGDGRLWRRRPGGSAGEGLLVLDSDHCVRMTMTSDEVALLPQSPLPEPPDGTRLEFEHHADLYAAGRDDMSSAYSGYEVGDGGDVWLLYGETIPVSWAAMWAMFGDSLRTAVRLVAVPEDLALREQWPNQIRLRRWTARAEA